MNSMENKIRSRDGGAMKPQLESAVDCVINLRRALQDAHAESVRHDPMLSLHLMDCIEQSARLEFRLRQLDGLIAPDDGGGT